MKSMMDRTLVRRLGWRPTWLDERKKILVRDGIDLGQWDRNLAFLGSGINPLGIVRDDEESETLSAATSLLVKVVLAARVGWDFPLVLSATHRWFLAAYPDVFDYFYPSPGYLSGDANAALQTYESQRSVRRTQLYPVLDLLEEQVSNACPRLGDEALFEKLLVAEKNYYKETLGRSFLLQKSG